MSLPDKEQKTYPCPNCGVKTFEGDMNHSQSWDNKGVHCHVVNKPDEVKPCCEKCESRGIDHDTGRTSCLNPNCPCHKPIEVCKHCGGDISIRNPKGFCDHLRYPESCSVCSQPPTPTENKIPGISQVFYGVTPTEGTEQWGKLEKLAMNIVYQLDDDAKLSVDFRQANNDRRIDFVIKLLTQAKLSATKQAVEKIINELEINPNPDGSISPNIQHWIEAKQIQLRAKFLTKKG